MRIRLLRRFTLLGQVLPPAFLLCLLATTGCATNRPRIVEVSAKRYDGSSSARVGPFVAASGGRRPATPVCDSAQCAVTVTVGRRRPEPKSEPKPKPRICACCCARKGAGGVGVGRLVCGPDARDLDAEGTDRPEGSRAPRPAARRLAPAGAYKLVYSVATCQTQGPYKVL